MIQIFFAVFIWLKPSSLSRNGAAKTSFVGKQNYLSEKTEGLQLAPVGLLANSLTPTLLSKPLGAAAAEAWLFFFIRAHYIASL